MSMIITNTTNKETKTHISEHRFGHVVFGTINNVKLYLSMETLCSIMENCPNVLFRDWNGVWCKLSHLYWLQQSLALVSRHPTSSVEEIVAIYCPQCLARYTEEEAATSFGCCSSCRECRSCRTILSIDDRNDFVSCKFCHLNLNSQSDEGTESKDKCFNMLLENIKLKLKPERNISDFLKDTTHSNVWQLSELNNKMECLSTNQSDPDKEVLFTLRSMQPQIDFTSFSPYQLNASRNVSLLSKRMLRSKPDPRTGRMVILVQPKTLPLEGDSSLKVQRGKWWLKDASAVHELPFVEVLALPSKEQLDDTRQLCWVKLCVSNPKITEVAITFCANLLASEGAVLDYPGFLHLDELGTSRIGCATNRLIASRALSADNDSTSDRLHIVLGGYEDELLMDASDTSSSAEYTSYHGFVEGVSGKDSSERSLDETKWRHTIRHNKAFVDIPVRIDPSNNIPTLERGIHLKQFVLHLNCQVEVAVGSVLDYPFKVMFN